MSKVIHKQGKQAVSVYVWFGQYEQIKVPLFAGAKGLYKGNTYLTTRLWKNVTCKKCLAKRG